MSALRIYISKSMEKRKREGGRLICKSFPAAAAQVTFTAAARSIRPASNCSASSVDIYARSTVRYTRYSKMFGARDGKIDVCTTHIVRAT